MEDPVFFYEDCELVVVKYVLESVSDVSIKYNWDAAAHNTVVNSFPCKGITWGLKLKKWKLPHVYDCHLGTD